MRKLLLLMVYFTAFVMIAVESYYAIVIQSDTMLFMKLVIPLGFVVGIIISIIDNYTRRIVSIVILPGIIYFLLAWVFLVILLLGNGIPLFVKALLSINAANFIVNAFYIIRYYPDRSNR